MTPENPREESSLVGLEPLDVEPTAIVIARRIRQAIMAGILAPGERLTEASLASRFQLSRGPLREALQRLSQEGLLETRRNRGMVVVTLTAEDVQDVYVARTACERAAALRLLSHGTEGWRDRMATALQRLEGAAAGDDWEVTMQADLAFHEEMVASSASPRLLQLFNTLKVETAMCLRELRLGYDHTAELAGEHRALLDALLEGDPTRVAATVEEHMGDAVQRLSR